MKVTAVMIVEIDVAEEPDDTWAEAAAFVSTELGSDRAIELRTARCAFDARVVNLTPVDAPPPPTSTSARHYAGKVRV
jgi:hypothetical protein